MASSPMSATADSIAKGLKNATWRGDHWTASCPTGNHLNGDRSAGLRIAEGDSVPVVVACAKCSNEEIFDKLTDLGLWAAKKGGAKKRATPKPRAAAPAQPGKRALSREEKRSKPVFPHAGIKKRYEYVNADGEVVFEVWRVIEGGEKSFRQHILVGGKPMAAGPDKEERILYNLPAVLVADPLRTIFVLEGEKDVDRATEMGLVATCNPGGAGKWEDQYSEALRGRRVVIVPDNDDAGRKHVQVVGSRLSEVAARVRVLELPGLEERGDFFDWAEAGGTKEAIADLLKTDARDWTASEELAEDIEPEPETDRHENQESGDPEPARDEATNFGLNSILEDAPFTVLGHDNGDYVFLAHGSQQIVTLTPPGMTANNLLRLAPLAWWRSVCAAEGSTKFDPVLCANLLVTACEAKGLFSNDIIRGRGAWWDDKRTVVHAGDKLFVDGVETPITKHPSDFIYPLAHALDVSIAAPLTVEEAQRFLDGVRMMTWASDLDSLLAAGWCVCAHIGGILTWRPHIWIIGAKGTGKTFFMENFLKPALADNQAGGRSGFVGDTTAAGIRQSLGCDALPVVLDEAEGENSRSVQRLQEVLALARQSSSGTGKIVKGTSGGSALAYQVRSCFAFSSINASIVQASDRSRIAVVELKPAPHRHSAEDLATAAFNLFQGDYASRFLARAIARAAMIRDAAKVFSMAAAALFGEQRAGDQYGALLAGAWSLTSDTAPSPAEAREWLSQFDWKHAADEVGEQSDESGLLQFILERKLRTNIGGATLDYAVGELIEEVERSGEGGASRALAQHGMKWNSGELIVSNTHSAIREMLRETPWSVNWAKVLVRLPGARPSGKSISFGTRNSTKAIIVPVPRQDDR